MGKFHIKANGEPGKCVAKPGNCRFAEDDDHHYTAADARKAYERSMAKDTIESYSRNHVSDSELTPEGLVKRARVTQALTSDLNYSGPSPKWLKSLQKESVDRWGEGNEPKIIDVIDSPAGELAVVWSPKSMNDNDKSLISERGFNLRETSFVSMETGQKLGYLKASFVDDESCEKSWGKDEYSSIRYMDEYDGHSFGTKEYRDIVPPKKWTDKFGREKTKDFEKVDVLAVAKTPEEILAAKKRIWAASHNALKHVPSRLEGTRIYAPNITVDHAPDNEQELEKELKPIRKIADKKYKDYKDDFKNPYVDYSSVDGSLQGQGFGGAIYVYTARMLGKEDRILRGSGLQSDTAKSAWASLSKDSRLPVKKLTQWWSKSESPSVCPVLDFRETKKAA